MINKQTAKSEVQHKQLSYNDIIEFLDKSWANEIDKTKSVIKKLDAHLGNPSKKLKTIFISGINGKSLTANFTSLLLKKEGLKVGAFYSPHILTYNERFSLNNEFITNKNFVEIANEVISASGQLNLKANTLELLTAMAIMFFEKNGTDVAIFEVSTNKNWDPVTICKNNVYAITRIDDLKDNPQAESIIKEFTDVAEKSSWVISADQSKINLQIMEKLIEKTEAKWAMPIRKLAVLPYPFEQLHGRCAALAERVAQIFLENYVINENTVVGESLLIKPKGQRGRPTIEHKRKLEQNPKKTIEHFWKEASINLNGRFELLDKERPSILLDNASNVDAFDNLLLGVRLLHYQKSLKGLAIIIGCENNRLENDEFVKQLRYFFKKTSGQVIFTPIKYNPYTETGKNAWDAEKLTNALKNAKVKAKVAKNFADALDSAKKSVDERNGLIVICGSKSIISEYWENKGIKKF